MSDPGSTTDQATPPTRLAYRPREFAAASGIPESSVWALVASGDLESFKVGRRRLIPADALDDFRSAAS